MNRYITHFHLFCGLGGGARGFNQGHARLGAVEARFRCLGGVDSDAAAIRDFDRLAGCPGTVLDLFSREQYKAFHGQEPPAGWREAGPAEIQAAAGGERPDIVFTSAPCKGFSGLLSQRKALTERYQALNGLTLRGVWLTLEAWRDDPVPLIVFENVPRIQTRGRELLDQIVQLLEAYGYAVAETTHDCGELGGLAQSRRRFLLVARHQAKVPPFLYEPQKRPLRAVGEVLGQMPLPDDPAAGPMHAMRQLQWRTWVRLALVEAGSDWRSLQRLAVEDGYLMELGIVPGWAGEYGQLGVRRWDEPTGAVSGQSLPGGGRYSVADPRMGNKGPAFNNIYRVIRFDEPAPTVTGGPRPASGGVSVADPRAAAGWTGAGKYRVTPWDEAASTVISGSTTGQGAFAIADPRAWRGQREHYQTGGHYGVVPWDGPSYAVTGTAKHDTGRWSVADPRPVDVDQAASALPEAEARGTFHIRALDGTWHRPFTTLELAALQGLVGPEDHLELDGRSDSSWRERIGNAVPAPAAAAIASVMAHTLLLARAGETFALSATPVWVRPVAVALSVHQERTEWTTR